MNAQALIEDEGFSVYSRGPKNYRSKKHDLLIGPEKSGAISFRMPGTEMEFVISKLQTAQMLMASGHLDKASALLQACENKLNELRSGPVKQ